MPIAFLSSDLEALKQIGKEIAEVVLASKEENQTMLIASSDMTHYEPAEVAQKKDREAIEAILGLDEDGLMEKIRRLDISMCGYAAVVVMLKAAKLLGAKSAQLTAYQTSGEVTGDNRSVVGYAGIIIESISHKL